MTPEPSVEAVVFDMDGVLVDTEHLWHEVRQELVADWGGRYSKDAQAAMMGMSSREWSRYMHDELALSESPEQINAEVVRRMLLRYERDLPVMPGAVAGVRRLWADGFPLAIASSSNRELIDAVLDVLRLAEAFSTTVSSEEVVRGKPSPDVYLEASRRLGIPPIQCVAIEDSGTGIRAGHAAGMRVIALPNARYPPGSDALALADAVMGTLAELTRESIIQLAGDAFRRR